MSRDLQDHLITLSGHRVLFLMAVDAEYGPELRKRIKPVMTGVGPIEAAMAAALILHKLTAANHRPDVVVCLGSAGSQRLEQGAVYQVSSVSWRDMDASALGFVRGVTPFLDHPCDVPLPTLIPDWPTARLSTGGNIVSGGAYALIDADMVDMETFAVWRACHSFGVPLVGLRGISDGAKDLRHYNDWAEYLPAVDRRLAEAVDALEAALGAMYGKVSSGFPLKHRGPIKENPVAIIGPDLIKPSQTDQTGQSA